jgi:hypothetical protein
MKGTKKNNTTRAEFSDEYFERFVDDFSYEDVAINNLGTVY